MKTKKIAFLGMMGALALTLGYLEFIMIPDIPFLPVGAKPGLSNIVTMFVAESLGFFPALGITVIKSGFALLNRGFSAFLLSLCGGTLSTIAMCAALKFKDRVFSFLGIGIISAVFHNMGQLFAAVLISGSPSLINYGKYLLLFSLVTGSVTGGMLSVLFPRLKKLKFFL